MSNIPSITEKSDLEPFRLWCQKVLPLTYDDSLSYYELLCKVIDSLNKTGEDMTVLYEYVNNYFTGLDTQAEINKALDKMASDGTLTGLIAPDVAEWLEDNITPTTPAVDASLSISGAAADAAKTGEISKNVIDFNSWDVMINKTKTNESRNGVSYVWSGETCIVSGSANPSSFTNLISSSNSLPVGVKGNTEYNVGFERTGSVVQLELIWYRSGEIIRDDYISNSTTITSPDNITGLIARLYVPNGYTANESVTKVYMTSGGINEIIKNFINPVGYKGIIPATLSIDDTLGQTIYATYPAKEGVPVAVTGFLCTIGFETGFKFQFWMRAGTGKFFYRYKEYGSTYTAWATIGDYIVFDSSFSSGFDLNNAEFNQIKIDSGNCVNSPESGIAAFVITLGANPGAHIQYWIHYGNGRTWFRRGLSGTWQAWEKMTGNRNPYSTMLSVGNSILTGTVYVNGSLTGNSKYGNAPYSVVADALDVGSENVNHILKSSTGILYDAGEGNFLNTIKGMNITDYDFIMTHFWTQDMNATYQLGTLNSTAGDGTLVGAILELLAYMRTQNGRCQLLLVSIPPCNPSISGANVFTGNYPNGKSIADLDSIMTQLAEREHFRYASWQDLNMSYYYQDYTDGANVHLNSENAYRTLGQYLAGKLNQS